MGAPGRGDEDVVRDADGAVGEGGVAGLEAQGEVD